MDLNFKDWLPISEVRYSEKMRLDAQEIKSFLGRSVLRRPVYHGTDKNFSQFKKMPSQRFVLFSAFDVEAQGFFFTENLADAKTFGRKVITAYIRMTNPLLDPRTMKHLGIDRLPYKKEAEMAFVLRHMLTKETPKTPIRYYRDKLTGNLTDVPEEDQLKPQKYMDLMVQRYHVNPKFAKEKDYSWIYNAISTGGLVWDAIDNKSVVSAMKQLGYDGTFVHENDLQLERSVFVMDENQVKIVNVKSY